MRLSAYITTTLTALVWAIALALGTAPYAVPASQAINIIASSAYDYIAPPSISRETYRAVWCQYGSAAACSEAGEMYDILVAAGFDPVIEVAQANHETTNGSLGVGQPAYKNAHGIQCHDSDVYRNGTTAVPWGNGCAGAYATYTDGLRAWMRVIASEYVDVGLTTPALAVGKYAPTSDGNDVPGYIADMERNIDAWRAMESPLQSSFNGGLDPRRRQVVDLALAQLGRPYALGSAGPDTFDCSGLVQWSYAQIGVETTRTTFSQLDNLPPIDPSQLLPGDLIYEQFPTDQHVVIFAGDLDGDGTGDAINAGGYFGQMNVNILYDFFGSHPTFTNAIIGYRRAL